MDWTKKLLTWYDANKRELPWRESKDPYRIWVSEVMSQQTRIEAMKPYFENWIHLFPTPQALAAASEEEVLKAWQGLGYYSRARNLQLGAREVVETYGGHIPRERKAVESLKGVGPYTAGAILSIAFNLPEVAVDGNVLRVYARLYNIDDDVLKSTGKKKITKLVEATLPSDRPGDFNEALMDFGASLCIPKSPRCEECPIQADCAAYKEGVQANLPVRTTKKTSPVIPLGIGLVRCGSAYLLHRRPDAGLLRSMWEFPTVEEGGPKELVELLARLGIKGSFDTEPTATLTHIFSHRRWEMTAWSGYGEVVTGNLDTIALPKDWRLVKKENFADLPWAGPHGKLTVYCKL